MCGQQHLVGPDPVLGPGASDEPVFARDRKPFEGVWIDGSGRTERVAEAAVELFVDHAGDSARPQLEPAVDAARSAGSRQNPNRSVLS
jgi:hypothetical protein